MTNEITTDEYFGGCPECGHTDGFLNTHSSHWFVCDQHRTKWCAGANLFSCWRDENEAVWTKNAIRIWHYRNVKPIYPEPTEEERRQMEEHDAMRAEAKRIDRGYGVQFGPDGIRAIGPGEGWLP